jgi:hypothetical protein
MLLNIDALHYPECSRSSTVHFSGYTQTSEERKWRLTRQWHGTYRTSVRYFIIQKVSKYLFRCELMSRNVCRTFPDTIKIRINMAEEASIHKKGVVVAKILPQRVQSFDYLRFPTHPSSSWH